MRSFWFACLTLISAFATADERILSFHSDIVVLQSGWIEVTEIIRVRAEGQQIRRGIYRDFPTDYKDIVGNDYQVRFKPLAVLRNDRVESFNAQEMGNGVRTYFGSSDRFIEMGEHTYTFRYEVSRSLGFFDDRDELYWNVTGNGWAFPIDRASARVSFEFDVPPDDFSLYAYTGRQGGKGQDYLTAINTAGNPSFETTRILGINEGLTISVAWPKGLVEEPGSLQKATWLLTDNLNLLIALAGLLAMLGYYIPVWRHFGKDPEAGVIFTRYEPPKGFSPASLRYIEQMYYDDTALTAAVVSLAVKGYLRITEDDDEHSLLRIDPGDNPAPLATGERELHDALFEDGDIVILDDKYHELLGGARLAHERSLRWDYQNRYFRTNGLLNLPALAIGFVASLIALRVASGATFLVIATIVLMVLVLVVFAIIMRRPTGLGRRLLDEVGGFREYMEFAEKDEMNLRNPPDKTPQLFEKYLPFALALDVEQQWAERFAAVFAGLRGPNGTDYHPTWYNGSWNSFDMSSTTAHLSSGLGSAISSSVTPPGSSSGGGGGGSSGGGGGGGGGGGW
jgi:uncharacterized membrane protein YgcG